MPLLLLFTDHVTMYRTPFPPRIQKIIRYENDLHFYLFLVFSLLLFSRGGHYPLKLGEGASYPNIGISLNTPYNYRISKSQQATATSLDIDVPCATMLVFL